MTQTSNRTESIFAAAAALAGAAERASYLDQACAGDAALRGHVEALLRAHERAGHLLDRNVPGGPERTIANIPDVQPGTIIARRYKLLEAIGQGGMGTVWVAEQTQPVRRKVALKLIKAGLDSKTVLARFEAERQALAVMDHPNIAKVLDGGLTETGRPFFVMEYVKGVPITEYCDATRLSVPERLNLFVQVCQAIQHAHQKGIIHRDLKPSNILVAPYDDRPVPKVIDFGLAKAMHQSLTERTLHTAHETVLGTPLYMSPEQAQLNNLDVDTRSDIYSLGVLLYELLTGTTPLENERFKQAAWDEVRRIIREEEAPRPSMRLSSSNTLASLAAGRQTEPARLTKLVRGELDWIVMRSLEKDRTRRYETANGFALDIQRYLAGEPVLAAPPSARYRLGKFARKHRTALTTAAGIALLLVAGVAVSAWQAVRATHAEVAARVAERDAKAQKANADQAAAMEKAANARAQKRLRQIEKANDILGSIFEDLDPKEIARGERPLQAILVEKLDKAVDQLEGESIGDPLVVAAMQQKLSASLLGLGEAGKAIVLLEKARATREAKLGHEHLLTLQAMNNLAQAYQAAGKLDLALPLFEETLKLRKATLGREHPDTLASMNNLATAYQDAGKPDLAMPLFEQALKLMKASLGPEHPDTLQTMNNLAQAYQDAGKRDLALPFFEETLKLRKARL
ncbi:MAG TPA: serine/threonine-protein kinase, partial [Pirellulales bacterium]|nr:serine/threonine-protein kinase [Pirellulales bacterium]